MSSPESSPSIPLDIGRVLQKGVVFNFSRHANRDEFMNAAHLPAEVSRFFDLMEERRVSYLLVGGVAMLTYVRGRNTEVVDLIISLVEQERLRPEVKVVEREGFFAEGRFGNLRVDFLAAEHSIFAQVVRDFSEDRRFDFLDIERSIPCASPAGLMLLKLYALPSLYRQGKIDRAKLYEGDVGALLSAFPDLDTESLLTLLGESGVSTTDLRELRGVISEQRPRPGRF